MRAVIIVVLSLISGYSFASDPQLVKKISERLGRNISSVQPSPIQGLLEVSSGGQIVYIDRDLKYLVLGNIFDVENKNNITKQRIEKLTVIDFKKLPFENAVRIKQGAASRKMFVYSDPNCGFCKKLENELKQINDVEIFILPYPILSEDSKSLARSVLCAKNPIAAWVQWMSEKVRPAEIECEISIEAILASGKKNHVRATPTLLFEDGSRLTGFHDVKDISKKLDEIDLSK